MPTDIRIDANPSGGALVMTVVGEVDLDNSHRLRDAFADADPGLPLILDLSEVSFMDSIGLSTLAQANRDISARGGAFVLIPSGALTQLITVSGLDRILVTYPNVAAALAAVAAEEPRETDGSPQERPIHT